MLENVAAYLSADNARFAESRYNNAAFRIGDQIFGLFNLGADTVDKAVKGFCFDVYYFYCGLYTHTIHISEGVNFTIVLFD